MIKTVKLKIRENHSENNLNKKLLNLPDVCPFDLQNQWMYVIVCDPFDVTVSHLWTQKNFHVLFFKEKFLLLPSLI